MTIGSLIRRDADRRQYHDHTRAADAMRADARRWRDLGISLTADKDVYGPDASDYLAGTIARLETVAAWAEHLAEKNQGYADQYWELIAGEST